MAATIAARDHVRVFEELVQTRTRPNRENLRDAIRADYGSHIHLLIQRCRGRTGGSSGTADGCAGLQRGMGLHRCDSLSDGCIQIVRSRYPQAKALTQASSPADAHKIITDTLPPLVASVLSTADVEQMREKLTRITDVPLSPQLRRNDWLGGVVVSLIVVLATLPVLVPLAVIRIRDERTQRQLILQLDGVQLFLGRMVPNGSCCRQNKGVPDQSRYSTRRTDRIFAPED